MRRVHCVQRPDMQMDGQVDDIPITCSFHAFHYKITYELCVTALFLFHVPHKRGEFENGLCIKSQMFYPLEHNNSQYYHSH
jgi:hypothetical protein